jgi:hypothetical protein
LAEKNFFHACQPALEYQVKIFPFLPSLPTHLTRAIQIKTGWCAGILPNPSGMAAPQGNSRRGRPARLRALYFRYRNINAATTNATAATLKATVNMLTITVTSVER